MKASEVKVGQYYRCAVGKKLTIIKILTESAHGGWVAKNEQTGRKMRIKSPARLKGMASIKVLDLDKNGQEEKPKEPTKSRLSEKLAATKLQMLGHVIVVALAGTGKTFTMIVGVARVFLKGRLWEMFVEEFARRNELPPNFNVTPSVEQAVVWDQLELSNKAKTVTYCAFNKSIVTEFGEKWGWLVEMLAKVGVILRFSTVNSLGNQTCSAAFGRLDVTSAHTRNLIEKITRRDIRELERNEPVLVKSVEKLVDLCKLTLVGWTEEDGFHPTNVTDEMLDELVAHYDIDLNGSTFKVYNLTVQVLAESVKVKGEIDFNDQNWLPVVLDLPVSQVDLLLVDEGQDLPRCKQEFARRVGRRIVLVGDTNQAIYGFAGADVESIPRMQKLLQVKEPLHLTETRRCGKAIVQRANATLQRAYEHRNETPLVFHAYHTNPEGIVREISVEKLVEETRDGDMVLCRVNAPLVSQALKVIKAGRKANIRGRNFGQSLIEFVRKMKAVEVSDLLDAVDHWYYIECEKENSKRNPSEAKLISLEDKRACIEAFCEDTATVEDVIANLRKVFAGRLCPKCGNHFDEELDRCPLRSCRVIRDPVTGYMVGPYLETPKGVLFSSVHRAKGLEADRVFILWKDAPMPHPMAKSSWQYGQELHCLYIAESRAKLELVDVR